MTSGVCTGSWVSRARWVLLVMAVLAGVLAMHALSPSGTPSAGQHVMVGAPGTEGHRAAAAPAHADDCACRHLSNAGHGGMVMDHSGGTCAAGGTAASYVPPALPPALTVPGECAAAFHGPPVAGTADGRAPPDLSELQLLRI
ncbi:DUF6153 family protein [Streptomyces sp. Ru72]|uniref:DUF6153 family protein n=1 Tax=Streptomyces sp. Ru72 TaxID=2080747 RepID=UPI000CDCE636|nr:DUF6153 family protein [Streptomyces sp. Ru72]POX53269.1 hypothetical protein C3488_05805 [Streptomyces sp. Ru72]